jgi:hypothetical protein
MGAGGKRIYAMTFELSLICKQQPLHIKKNSTFCISFLRNDIIKFLSNPGNKIKEDMFVPNPNLS